ncbi:MAG: hypothetical protein ACYDEV_02100 [Acidiferrobacter sp.]
MAGHGQFGVMGFDPVEPLGMGPACAPVLKILLDCQLSDLRKQHLTIPCGIGAGGALAKEGRSLINQLATLLGSGS